MTDTRPPVPGLQALDAQEHAPATRPGRSGTGASRAIVNAFSLAAFVFVIIGLWAAGASAATACETDDHCPAGTTCVDNRCALASATQKAAARPAPADPGADDECGADRRCRIERLARKNRARRKAQVIREEMELASLLRRRQQHRDESIRRKDKPWTIGINSSPLYEVGYMVGYSFTPAIKAELSLHLPSQAVYKTIEDVNVDGAHDHTAISAGPTYYFWESTVSPYLKGTFIYTTGEFRSWGFEAGETVSTTQHALSLGGGVDVQFELGFHLRLGLSYRMLLFNQARREPGNYNQYVEQALEEEFFPLDGVFLFGWAF